MCGLTTEWILESAQSLACALIRRTFYALERRTTHSSGWEGTQTLRRERQAHRWPSGWGEQCWLDQQGERPITELWGAEKLGRSEGSGMLIGDPLVEGSSGERRTHSSEWEELSYQWGALERRTHSSDCNASSTRKESDLSQSSEERRTHSSEWEETQTLRRERHAQEWPSNEGSNASSTYNELWRVENSFLRMRRHSAAQKGVASPTMSSGEQETHSSEWEGTPPLRRERHAHRWPSG